MVSHLHAPVVYQRVLELVRKFIIGNCGSLQDADEILHQGFCEYFNRISSSNFKLTGKPEYYIYSICKKLWYRELRNRDKTMEYCMSDEMDNFTEDDTNYIEIKNRNELLLKILNRGLKQLSPKCQKVFQLRKEGLSCQQIAKKMNFKNASISKNKFYRCKKKLLEVISEDKDYIEYMGQEERTDAERR